MRRRLAAIGEVVARGAALFLGGFVLIGLVGELRGRQTNIELWIVDIRDVDPELRLALLATFAGLLTAWAIVGGRSPWLRRLAAGVTLLFALLAVRDVVAFGSVVASGNVRPSVAIPLSALLTAGLVVLARAIWFTGRGVIARDGPANRRSWRGAGAIVGAAAFWALLFPMAQMAFFGTTDYRRPAYAAVVFGARVYANGSPSPLLADRIAAAVELYRSREVGRILMSGGNGADGFNEATVMRDVAVSAGVDPEDVSMDPAGVTTEATVSNTIAWATDAFSRMSLDGRLIAVSQAYHLPRIQLAFAAAGLDILTVPAVDPEPISEMPLLVAREIPAFWSYYVRQCLG